MRLIKALTLTISILFLFASHGVAEKRDSIVVSLVTCWPGADVYALCGHEAVRVRSASMDSVWNYGTFDFNQPHFLYRFVKGETDYKLTAIPYSLFMPEYLIERRRVVEQELNLTQDEAWKMLARLRHRALPENATYRYNYVKDNCATRIIDDIDRSTDSEVIYPDTVKYDTFRNAMRAYHKDYPWYQFGIDVALGSGIDYQLKGRDEMFVPLEMMEKAAGAHLSDGRQLVSATRVLNEGDADATLGPTHWSRTPIVVCSVFFVIATIASLLQLKRKKIFRPLYSVWFFICGAAGVVVTFLVTISVHEATSPNILILWLNPLQLILAIGVWWPKKLRYVNLAIAYYDVIVTGILLIIWPFQNQSGNIAIFPLMGATLALALAYAIILTKSSYKIERNTHKNEEINLLGAIGSSRSRRGGSKHSGKATTRGGNHR
ncbi:MAG: DUF4105 domain-containing protein [Candidatus Amulumruptor caecigallinarius]|nr:DUF4105 domain-containing protein [Candidatus Amulumruptor caecigallinarius]